MPRHGDARIVDGLTPPHNRNRAHLLIHTLPQQQLCVAPCETKRLDGQPPSALRTKQHRLHLPRTQRDQPRKRVTHFQVGIDAERVQQAGCQILGRDRIVRGIGGKAIRAADDPAPRQTAAQSLGNNIATSDRGPSR